MSMTTEQNARRASVRLTINGHDATDYISPSLLDFSYTDNLSGKADEVQISLQDREARWNGPWKPQKGMKVEASLTVHDWFGPDESASLNCGSFKIDEVTLDGPPDVFKVKAVSASLTSGLREEAKTRAWENQTLKGVAGQIAQEHGLELHYTSGESGEGEDFPLSRQDQREEADLPFVSRLAHERAMHCKVHDNKLILDDSIKAEQKKTSLTLSRVGGDCPVTRYSFKQSSAGTDYTKAEVAYTDPSTGQVHTATAQVSPQKSGTTATDGVSGGSRMERQGAFAEPASANMTAPPERGLVGPPDEKTMLINARMESSAEAMRAGGAALHNANKSKDTASADCMGHPGLVAGLTVNLAGFGDFSGAYLIEKATHKLGSGGYTTSLELRKCRLAPDVRMSSGSKAVAQNVPTKKPQPDPTPDPAPALPPNPVEKWATLFDMFRQFWLASGVDEMTKLLLCLPHIAESMAGKAGNAADAQGWLYLQTMFHHWFSGKSSKGGPDGEPFWVDWEWGMSFVRAAQAYAQFVDMIPSVEQQILNYPAKLQLGKIVTRQPQCKALGMGEHWDFDFISTPWTEWEDKYHTLKAVPRDDEPDGLMAAMAGFTLRALACGSVQREGGGYTITVRKIGVFVHDKFQFEMDASATANKLGYWSCTQLSFSRLPFPDHELLYNETFREFRNSLGHGGDFLVLSQPHLVENFTEARYDYA